MEIEIWNSLTISSLSHRIMDKFGAFDKVSKVHGSLREFYSQAIVGGRVLSLLNEKHYFQATKKDIDNKKIINDFISDFDAVSLYPSAIVRVNGYPTGLASFINSKDELNDILKGHLYFIAEIKITKINKTRAHPLIAVKKNNVNREWVGSSELENSITVTVDKIALEDFIKYHEIEFEFIRGVYWNGYNDKVCEIVNKMFETRKEKKKDENPLEQVYKLLMNAAYGKTILKPNDKHNLIFDGDFDEFLTENYGRIVSWQEMSSDLKDDKGEKIPRTLFKIRDGTFSHQNSAHCGVHILSMSKRIMNEVICLADDLGIYPTYLDTDSMHIKFSQLTKKYQETYKRKLVGKEMGQFHTDFKYSGKGEAGAITSIILGKKIYTDVLVGMKSLGKDEEGLPNIETINGYYVIEDENEEQHQRLKGISEKAREIKINKLGFYQLWNSLYDGKEIEFDLSGNFKYEKYEVSTNKHIIRKVKI
ncbi:hypothetical protein P9112_005196 [Eukaryota sp. TZLM1-RC]